MDEVKPTLSVVMTNYNHAKYLTQSLGSILSQSYRPLEVLVIDDGSTDDSVAIIEALATKHPWLTLIRNEKNLGVQISIKRLLERASGTHISFQSADDQVFPGFFESAMRQFEAHPDAGFCSGLSAKINEDGRAYGYVPGPVSGGEATYFTPEAFVRTIDTYGCWIMGNATVANRQRLLDAGGFRPELSSFADGFMYTVIGARSGACFIPQVLAALRITDSSYSASVHSDIESTLTIADYSFQLMTGEFSGLFSPEFSARFRNRLRYGAGMGAVDAALRHQNRSLLRLSESVGWWPEVVAAVLRWSMRLQLALWQFALFLCFRRGDVWSQLSRRIVTRLLTSPRQYHHASQEKN